MKSYRYYQVVAKFGVNLAEETVHYEGEDLEKALKAYDTNDPFMELRCFEAPLYDEEGDFIADHYNYDLYEDYKDRLIELVKSRTRGYLWGIRYLDDESREEILKEIEKRTEEEAEKIFQEISE